MSSESPVLVWVYVRAEIVTGGSFSGNCYLVKSFEFPSIPPPGFILNYWFVPEIDEKIHLDEVSLYPEDGTYRAEQTSWISIGFGEVGMWKSKGWEKQEIPKDLLERMNVKPRGSQE